MQKHIIISNRASLASDGGWIHIVPNGELPNADGKIVQVLDDTSMDSILANIQKDKTRLGDKWPGIYGGREHFIYDDGKDSAALAWFKDFEKRDDGIWASEDGLTPAGSAAIQNSEYKFTSFVVDHADLQKMAGQFVDSLPCYRVMKIDTIGFTNLPNAKELLTPITNRQQNGADSEAENTDENGFIDPYPTPDLDQWFIAVKAIQDTARQHGGIGIDWNTAWNMAKKQFPAVYAAAFPVTGGDDGHDDAQAGSAQVSALANRIKNAAGKDFQFGWNFIKSNLPRVFNRSLPREMVLNRQPAKGSKTAIAASNALRGFAQDEREESGGSFDQAWRVVCNRYPRLVEMANQK